METLVVPWSRHELFANFALFYGLD